MSALCNHKVMYRVACPHSGGISGLYHLAWQIVVTQLFVVAAETYFNCWLWSHWQCHHCGSILPVSLVGCWHITFSQTKPGSCISAHHKGCPALPFCGHCFFVECSRLIQTGYDSAIWNTFGSLMWRLVLEHLSAESWLVTYNMWRLSFFEDFVYLLRCIIGIGPYWTQNKWAGSVSLKTQRLFSSCPHGSVNQFNIVSTCNCYDRPCVRWSAQICLKWHLFSSKCL